MGKVMHFEIPASDLKRAQDFYSSVFGWEMKPFNDWYLSARTASSDENGMSKEPGVINGGIQKRGVRAIAPTIVLSVESIDLALSKVEQAGGSVVVSKEEVAEMGWYAQFNDTEGNRIGLFQVK